MFLFDGSSAKKIVSLRGQTQQQNKDSAAAARDAARARAERAALRLANNAATTLQRHVRGRLSRQHTRARLRAEWDAGVPADIEARSSSLLHFFEPAHDASRLAAQLEACFNAGHSASHPHVVVRLVKCTLQCSLVTPATPSIWATLCQPGSFPLHAAVRRTLVTGGFFSHFAAHLLQSALPSGAPEPLKALLATAQVLLGPTDATDEEPGARAAFARQVLSQPLPDASLAILQTQLTLAPEALLVPLATMDPTQLTLAQRLCTVANTVALEASAAAESAAIQTAWAAMLSRWLPGLPSAAFTVVIDGPADAGSDSDSEDDDNDDDDDDDKDGKDDSGDAAARSVPAPRTSIALPAEATRCLPWLRRLLDRATLERLCLRLLDDVGVGTDVSSSVTLAAAATLAILRVAPAADRVALLGAVAFRPGRLVALWRCLGEVGATTNPELLTVFLLAYNHQLMVLDDADFFGERTLSLADNAALVARLRCIVVTGLLDPASTDSQLVAAAEQVLHALHDRDARRTFVPAEAWLASEPAVAHAADFLATLTPEEFRTGSRAAARGRGKMGHGPPPSQAAQAATSGVLRVLRRVPYVVPFAQRVRLFQTLVAADRAQLGADLPFDGRAESSLEVTVRRATLYSDAFSQLHGAGARLRRRLRVRLINALGLDEAGIDGGGLSRELLQEALRAGFNPDAGFFTTTAAAGNGELYPSALALAAAPADAPAHFEFLGSLLGKALYDGMTVDVPLSTVFLGQLLGRAPSLHDLAALDPELHRNLLFLRDFAGDFAALALDFTVADAVLGGGGAVARELVPGGRTLPVTRANVLQYVFLVADHRLNRALRPATQAFRRGLAHVVDLAWLALFDARELQTLVGGRDAPLDLADWRAHTHYGGGLHATHPLVEQFWRVVESLSEPDRRALVKFVTSSPRAPLMGFAALQPRFGIMPVGDGGGGGGEQEESRLPSSATCMNLLKLPRYADDATLRAKLLYAVHAGAGFELS